MVIMMDMAIVLVMTLTGMMITALVAAMMGCGMVMLVVREVGAPSITPQGTSPQPLSDLLEPLSHCLIMRLPISSNCEWPFM